MKREIHVFGKGLEKIMKNKYGVIHIVTFIIKITMNTLFMKRESML